MKLVLEQFQIGAVCLRKESAIVEKCVTWKKTNKKNWPFVHASVEKKVIQCNYKDSANRVHNCKIIQY